MRQNRVSDRIEPAPGDRRDRALERAIVCDAIELRFQPQSNPRTGHVEGAEALARWSGAETPRNCSAGLRP